MDFIIDNYVWFIVGGVVLLMIIIGYFAEKTNFGKKPLNEKKAKNETKEINASVENENPVITEIQDQTATDVLNDPLEEELNIPVDSEIFDVDMPVENESLSEVKLPEEDLNVPFGDVEVQANNQKEEISAVDEVVEDEPETDEDDVWKF